MGLGLRLIGTGPRPRTASVRGWEGRSSRRVTCPSHPRHWRQVTSPRVSGLLRVWLDLGRRSVRGPSRRRAGCGTRCSCSVGRCCGVSVSAVNAAFTGKTIRRRIVLNSADTNRSRISDGGHGRAPESPSSVGWVGCAPVTALRAGVGLVARSAGPQGGRGGRRWAAATFPKIRTFGAISSFHYFINSFSEKIWP